MKNILKKLLTFFILIIIFPFTLYSQVSISTDGNVGNSNSILHIRSGEKGVLFPNFDKATIAKTTGSYTPQENGMIVYCNNCTKTGLYIFKYNTEPKWQYILNNTELKNTLDTIFDNSNDLNSNSETKSPSVKAIRKYISDKIQFNNLFIPDDYIKKDQIFDSLNLKYNISSIIHNGDMGTMNLNPSDLVGAVIIKEYTDKKISKDSISTNISTDNDSDQKVPSVKAMKNYIRNSIIDDWR